ncbi:NAD-dependent epimerase/dehydratase family protein [Desulfurivibrio sp. C05AmB]|uniref:NAD-dependent epimerase/dehydratase family protein n=1 Tax=Desulfurivibrio sp. C05AmB TaxID=3374371 RepID=UPI00376EF797
MKVFVFGATGFLGRALVQKMITSGSAVSVLTRNPSRINSFWGNSVAVHVGDMSAGKHPKLSEYDVVINCAGETKDERLMRQLHVEATKKTLENLRSGDNTQWIQVSSVGVYGPQNSGVIKEDYPFNPVGEYEITKAEGEIVVHEFCENNNIPYTIIRPSNIFGNGMTNQSLAQLVRMISRNLFFYIGNPLNYKMNYVHVDDVVAAIILCMKNPAAINQDFIVSDVMDQYSFVNLVKSETGGGWAWTPVIPKYLARKLSLLAKINPKFPLSSGRLAALTNRAVYSTDKIRDQLAFTPIVGIREGLRQYCRNLAL